MELVDAVRDQGGIQFRDISQVLLLWKSVPHSCGPTIYRCSAYNTQLSMHQQPVEASSILQGAATQHPNLGRLYPIEGADKSVDIPESRSCLQLRTSKLALDTQ